jgi:hypothetical protein
LGVLNDDLERIYKEAFVANSGTVEPYVGGTEENYEHLSA